MESISAFTVCGRCEKLFTQEHKGFTYLTISTVPNCTMPRPGTRMRLGMKTKLTDKLSVLRANDHFRDWHTLDDERVCALCNRKFNGYEVAISTMGDEVQLRCPTPYCQSGVHQWLHPTNAYLSEENEKNWWHALGSNGGPDNASVPSPQPV
jgi:hypothetical protein